MRPYRQWGRTDGRDHPHIIRKGHKYLTRVVDHDSGRLVWAAPGRDKATLGAFFDALAASGETAGEDRCSLITHVFADGAEWIAGVVARRWGRWDYVR